MRGRPSCHTLLFSYGQDLPVKWDTRGTQTTLATINQNPSPFLSVATTMGRYRAIQEDMGVPGSSDSMISHIPCKSSFPSDHCQPSETSTRSIQNQALASAAAVPGGESRHENYRGVLGTYLEALRGYQIHRQGSRAYLTQIPN